ncbi:MAG: peptidoglycan-associated lipoprotein Pal [Gammaproteobacteria bacterium]|jgi:peptidoglycan-associated lipoprotein|nr:peptidoglycan-associated lipoprotein Pal [Gammaproteobacteria bacterium]
MTYKHVLIILMIALFSGCTTNTKDDSGSATVEDKGSASGSDTSGSGSDAGSTRTYGVGAEGDTSMTALDDPQSPLSVRIIYFDYDSSEIQSQFRDTIEAHSAFLIANPNVIVALEGHADERGSREYNLALGERRSQTVKRQMTLLGVPSSQIRATSYGEERPVSEEHDDFAWSQNRRVEIVY